MIKSRLIFKTPKDGHYFFGYYDKLQLSKDSDKFLVLKVDFIDRVPDKDDKAIIGYFDLKNDNKFIKIASTSSFNWQQGCMLQWLGPDFNNCIIYNDYVDDKFVSIKIDVNSGKKTVYLNSIYSTHPNGKLAITIDFERHHWCRRGYSYDGNFDKSKKKKIVEGDAIWLIDLENNSSKKIIHLKDVIDNQPLTNMKNATHYLEHLMFNPSGNGFCFLHRWKIADGGIYARLYKSNLDGTDVTLLNDSGRMSHFGWRDDKYLLGYGGFANKINSLRKYKNILRFVIKPLLPFYHMVVNDNSRISKLVTGDSYLLFNTKEKSIQKVAESISSEDGHPSFSKNGHKDVFITDTYPDPDEGSIAKLIAFNIESNDYVILDQLNSISKYDNSPIRCDLHPRWSYSGKYVSIDTMNDDVRSSYLYEILYE
jgi:hypothetical protein